MGPESLKWAPVDFEKSYWEPYRAHEDDAGFDLYTSEDTWINPGEFKDIPTNVRVILPFDKWGMLTGRSSTLRKRGLLVNQGIIDTGYRGELYAGVWNLSPKPVRVERGERISQLILIENGSRLVEPVLLEAWEFDRAESTRGISGFGSSGL